MINRNYNHKPSPGVTEGSHLIQTIYKNAVEKMISSSPEEAVDISDDNADFFPDAGIIPSEGSNCTQVTTTDARYITKTRPGI